MMIFFIDNNNCYRFFTIDNKKEIQHGRPTVGYKNMKQNK